MANIEKDSISNLYIFSGTESFKKKNYLNQLKKLIGCNDEINYSFYSGKNINFSDVYDSVITMPFFAEKKLVVVENSGVFKVTKKKKEGDSSEREETAEQDEPQNSTRDKMVEKIIDDLPVTTCLVFLEDETNATKRIYKKAASKGKIISCLPDDTKQILPWLAKGFSLANKNIRKSTAELIIERVGTNYIQLKNEVEKLISYVGDSNEIKDEDVLAVTSQNVEDRIFDVLDAICRKDTTRAVNKYYSLLANRMEPLYILSMLRRQFRILVQVRECVDAGYGCSYMVENLGLRDFVVEKNIKYSKFFDMFQLEKILERICDTDMDIKTGVTDGRIGVEMLLVEFSR